MPGLLPPLYMSTPPPPFLPELLLKKFGKAFACVDAARGQVPPPPSLRWSDGRQIFVKQQCCSATNICLWMTARWRISPMEVVYQIQWPPLTLCWSTNVPCCSQHRQRLVFMLAPAHNLNMSRCYFQKSLQCVLATGNSQKSPYPFQEITQGTNTQLLQRGCTQSCSICMSHGNSSPQPWNLDWSSSLPQFSTAFIRPPSSPTGGVSDCD